MRKFDFSERSLQFSKFMQRSLGNPISLSPLFFPLSVLPYPVPFFSTGGTLPGEPSPAPSLGTARLQAALRRAAAPGGGARELKRWRVGAAREAAGELARALAREPSSGRQRERAEAQRERAAVAGAGASGRRRGSARAWR
jgi:hypothetical protein